MERAGAIEVICGPMFSGKTEELIRRLRRAQIARQRVLVYKPAIDDRYHATEVVSHSSQRIPSQPVKDIAHMREHLRQVGVPEVLGIDEAQFFGEDLTELCETLADRGVRVVVAGLDVDYLAQPFGPIPPLLAIAESITKQSAVCMVCGSPASRSQRVNRQLGLFAGREAGDAEAEPSRDTVLVGAQDSYEARCRRCFVKDIDVPSA